MAGNDLERYLGLGLGGVLKIGGLQIIHLCNLFRV